MSAEEKATAATALVVGLRGQVSGLEKQNAGLSKELGCWIKQVQNVGLSVRRLEAEVKRVTDEVGRQVLLKDAAIQCALDWTKTANDLAHENEQLKADNQRLEQLTEQLLEREQK